MSATWRPIVVGGKCRHKWEVAAAAEREWEQLSHSSVSWLAGAGRAPLFVPGESKLPNPFAFQSLLRRSPAFINLLWKQVNQE